jgi:hypothetical protein
MEIDAVDIDHRMTLGGCRDWFTPQVWVNHILNF